MMMMMMMMRRMRMRMRMTIMMLMLLLLSLLLLWWWWSSWLSSSSTGDGCDLFFLATHSASKILVDGRPMERQERTIELAKSDILGELEAGSKMLDEWKCHQQKWVTYVKPCLLPFQPFQINDAGFVCCIFV